MKETRIILEYGKSTVVAKIARASLPTVRKALAGDVRVLKYALIRKIALEHGGKEMREVNK